MNPDDFEDFVDHMTSDGPLWFPVEEEPAEERDCE